MCCLDYHLMVCKEAILMFILIKLVNEYFWTMFGV